MNNRQISRRGQLLIQTLVLSALSVVFISVLTNLAVFNIDIAKRSYYSEVAFQTAEAGIEYYRWHLAHAPSDFQDGTGGPGPYVHEFKDKDLVRIGQFSLDITPPSLGSTLVTILSTATVDAEPSAIRKIRVRLAIPSLAKYATVAGDKMRFGEGTEVFGLIHSNDGIRFDGVANNLVTSAKASYDDQDHDESGQDKLEFGVHTHRDPPPSTNIPSSYRPLEVPPNPVQNRPEVFRAGRQFPVPAFDFVGLTADLADIKTDAETAGRYFASSGVLGYEVVLRPNNTFEVYKVTATMASPNNCSYSSTGWGTWSITATSSAGLANPYAIPANGAVFFEDHVWVSGLVNVARITIASGRFPESPSTNTDITVNNDLRYTNYDGQDVVSLIAQRSVNIGLKSENDLRIDAALVAKNGRVGRHYYRSDCGTEYKRNNITLYGSIATNQRYGFSWSCSGVYCSGYASRTIMYDANLLYGPPPSFPLISDEYELISWEEVK